MGRFIVIIPVLLLIFKVVEVLFEKKPFDRSIKLTVSEQLSSLNHRKIGAREAEKRLKGAGLPALLGYGVLRRLDDVSFWGCVASLYAASRILTVSPVAGKLLPKQKRISYLPHLCVIVFILLWVPRYVMQAIENSGSWYSSNNLSEVGRWVVGFLKIAEYGAVSCAELILAYVCLNALYKVRMISVAPFDNVAASELITACVSSFPIIFIAFGIYKLIASEIGFSEEGWFVFGIKLLGTLLINAVPSLIVAFAACIAWGSRAYRIALSKELLEIQVS